MPIPAPAPSAETYGDVIERVRYLLRSYTGNHEVSTYLTAEMSNEALTATLDDGDAVTSGLVEIDDELIWVKSASGATLTVPPYGRGYAGSVAATHTTGTQVISDPAFPRVHIAAAILDTQRTIYPTVFAPTSTDFVWTAGVRAYEMPAACDRILSVAYQATGTTDFWKPVNRYRLDTNADTTTFPSGRALVFYEGAPVDQTVRVVYAAGFTEFTSTASTLVGAGHELSQFDLLVYGAAMRLVQFVEVGRLQTSAVENPERSKYSPPGAASALTRQLVALYDRRLAEESKRLRDRYPVNVTFRTR